jgi:ABC-type transporter Mla maintaining outer membrane lipid asymmetry permease subunit MlaE
VLACTISTQLIQNRNSLSVLLTHLASRIEIEQEIWSVNPGTVVVYLLFTYVTTLLVALTNSVELRSTREATCCAAI